MTTNFKPTRAQVEAAARKWIEQLDSDAHWAHSPGARERASSEKKILEWLFEAAAGVAPPAPSEYAYCPIHGDLLAANRSYRCGNAPTGHEYAAPVQPSSAVDVAALIREAKAEALEEKGYFLKGHAEWTRSNFLPGPHSDACAKYNDEIGDELIEDAAELRARAAEYREGSET